MTSIAVAKALDAALDKLLASDAPLGERLAEYAQLLREINRPFAEAVERLVDRLRAVGAGAGAPGLGDALPSFLLPDQDGQLRSLEMMLQHGPLVVAFRRGHWCPYCQLSTGALASEQATLSGKGAHVVVITPEREHFARALKQHVGADFPILADVDNGYAIALGLAISVGEEMRYFMTRRGRDLGTYQGNDAWILPIPATFVIDPKGIIVMRHVDADYRRRAAIEDIVSAVEAITR